MCPSLQLFSQVRQQTLDSRLSSVCGLIEGAVQPEQKVFFFLLSNSFRISFLSVSHHNSGVMYINLVCFEELVLERHFSYFQTQFSNALSIR